MENNLERITFKIDEKLDEEFRNVIARSKGIHKGVIGETLEEAIRNWIRDEKKGKN